MGQFFSVCGQICGQGVPSRTKQAEIVTRMAGLKQIMEIFKAINQPLSSEQRVRWYIQRKHLGIFLCVIAVVGVLFTVALQKKDSKSEIFSFVRENQTHLSQFVCDTMEAGKIVSTYRNWSVDYYEGVGAVEFLTNSFGIGPATTYEGFYYSENDIPIGFQGVNLNFIQNENGWTWQEADGDNYEQTERIIAHWFWFKISF